MKLQIDYSKQAQKFLMQNEAILTIEQTNKLIIKAMKKLLKIENTNIDVQAMKGEWCGFYRIRVGNVRMIFSYQNDVIIIVSVLAIGFRGNIYK